MRNKIDTTSSTIKAAHRRRSRNSQASPQVMPVRRRTRFGITQNADATNANLRAFIELHGKADLGCVDAPWPMGRQTTATRFSAIRPENHYPTMSPRALRDFGLARRSGGMRSWVSGL